VRHRALDVVVVLYLAVMSYGVFGPSPGDELEKVGDRVSRVHAVTEVAAGDDLAGTAPAGWAPREVLVGLTAEQLGNILLFVPFGVLWPMRWPRWRRTTIVAGIAASSAIELTQNLLPWRSPSLQDVWWNATGTAWGFAVWALGSMVALRLRGITTERPADR
jgi:hypothetical protein